MTDKNILLFGRDGFLNVIKIEFFQIIQFRSFLLVTKTVPSNLTSTEKIETVYQHLREKYNS